MNIYSGGRCDEWGTPPELIEKLNLKEDTFDVCASAILFLKGRTNYVIEGKGSKGVPFGSAIIYFNMWPFQLKLEGQLITLKI